MPNLRQAGRGRASDRAGVHRIGAAVPDTTRRREEVLALPRVRGQERRALHAGRSGAHPAPGHGEGRQDLRQGHPLLAGRPGRQLAARDSASHDGAY